MPWFVFSFVIHTLTRFDKTFIMYNIQIALLIYQDSFEIKAKLEFDKNWLHEQQICIYV